MDSYARSNEPKGRAIIAVGFSNRNAASCWFAAVVLLLGMLLSACNLSNQSQATSTATPNVTQAYQTVAARLTEIVALTPTEPPTPIPTEGEQVTPTPSVTPTASRTPPPITPSPTPPCDRAAAGSPLDITIPDDTPLKPGESFSKEWGLVNTGTCAWTRDYAAVWFSGEMMSAPSVVSLDQTVDPGETVVIAVEMVAPAIPGTYQGNWKLRNETGLLFGIGPNGNSSFWVRIEVIASSTTTPDPSPSLTPEPGASPTLSPTPSPTPETQVSGNISLLAGELIDLDALQIPGASPDLLFDIGESNGFWLTPQAGVLLGVFGSSEPSPANCLNTNLGGSALPVDSLPTGSFLCYRTSQSLYGWAQLVNLDITGAELELEILTWAQP